MKRMHIQICGRSAHAIHSGCLKQRLDWNMMTGILIGRRTNFNLKLHSPESPALSSESWSSGVRISHDREIALYY